MEDNPLVNEVGASQGPEIPGDGGMELAAVRPELNTMGDAQLVTLPDGSEALVSGDPYWADDFNHFQGDNPEGFSGTCGLVSCEDILRQFGQDVDEAAVVGYAVDNGFCQVTGDPENSGGTSEWDQEQILENFGIDCHVEMCDSLDDLAERVDQGRGVIAGINSATIWGTPDSSNGMADHAIVVTGVARDPETGAIEGFFINDSGVPPSGNSACFVDAETFRQAWLGSQPFAGVGEMVVTEQPVPELADGPDTTPDSVTAAAPGDMTAAAGDIAATGNLDTLPDGRVVLVSGDPDALAEVNHPAGDNTLGFEYTNSIVDCQNVLALFGIHHSEDELVRYAADHDLCTEDPDFSGYASWSDQVRLLADFGVPASIHQGDTTDQVAAEVEAGCGVIVAVNPGELRNDPNLVLDGGPYLTLTVTGVARDVNTNEIVGFYVNDGITGESAVFVDAATFSRAFTDEATGATISIVTDQPAPAPTGTPEPPAAN